MNIKIEVKIISPEIIAALLALAEALPQIKTGALGTVKEEKKQELAADIGGGESNKEAVREENLKQETHEEQAETISIEVMREKLAELSRAGKQAAVMALLKKFGGNKLREISKERYGEMLREAKGL
jgi:hypothetical protein